MTAAGADLRRGAVALVAFALVPLTAMVASFGPAAVAIGLSGLRRGSDSRALLLLMLVVGLLGVVALWSSVLPVALGRRRDAALGLWRVVALGGGVVVAIWLLATLGEWRGPPEKAYITLWVAYSALSGLAGAVWVITHRTRPDHTP